MVLLEKGVILKDLPHSPEAIDELNAYFIRQVEV
jgi:hypothetical protein